MKLSHILITATLLFGAAQATQAARLSAEASTDSLQMTMGSRGVLKVEVTRPAGFGRLAGEPRPGSEFGGVEILDATVDSTPLAEGAMRYNYNYRFQAFEPGAQTLPAITYYSVVDGHIDSAKTKPIVLKVFAVSVDSLQTTRADAPTRILPAKWVDYVPDAIWSYWWVWLLAALLIGGGALVWWLIVKKGRLQRVAKVFRKPPEAPFDRAIRRLNEIRQQRLAMSGNDKHYYTELTDVLRDYLDGRFGIAAMEMTSGQILHALADNADTARFRDDIAPVLNVADSVKFARLSTTPDENQKAYGEIRKMVELTKPVEETNAQTRQQRRKRQRSNNT